MKNQALFSLKDKSKKKKMSAAAFLFGTLRINTYHNYLVIRLRFCPYQNNPKNPDSSYKKKK